MPIPVLGRSFRRALLISARWTRTADARRLQERSMNTRIRIAILATSVMTLAACNVIQPEALDQKGIDAAAARDVTDYGSAFQRSLHQGYADMGRYEYQQADFHDAKYFNDKARAAAAGSDVQPVVLSTRHLTPAYQSEMAISRERL